MKEYDCKTCKQKTIFSDGQCSDCLSVEDDKERYLELTESIAKDELEICNLRDGITGEIHAIEDIESELEDWDAASEALEHWGILRPPSPPPPEITRITEQIRAHGR